MLPISPQCFDLRFECLISLSHPIDVLQIGEVCVQGADAFRLVYQRVHFTCQILNTDKLRLLKPAIVDRVDKLSHRTVLTLDVHPRVDHLVDE